MLLHQFMLSVIWNRAYLILISKSAFSCIAFIFGFL